MRISEIDGQYYVFRNGVTLTMTVVEMRTGELKRRDTGLFGDKTVPDDIQRAIRKKQTDFAPNSHY